MHGDIATVLKIIKQRIATLQIIYSQLEQEFGSEQASVHQVSLDLREPSSSVKHISQRTNGNGRQGRKDEIANFIKAPGPSTRGEILAGTDVPRGTIAYALNDKERFARLPDGKWTLAEQ